MPLLRLLIVDDEDAILKQLKWAYGKEYVISTASTAGEAIDAVTAERPDLMILDLSLSGDPARLEGFDVLERALSADPHLKVIVITGHDDTENALEAIEKGAVDFYAKPVDVDELRVMLKRAGYIRSLEGEISRLRENAGGGSEFEGIIGVSDRMASIFETIRKVAPTDVSILLTGESGTGKELIANAIHRRSQRSQKPFMPINCGAIPENLLESELFGHEKGSFTGADAMKRGRFEKADGGTIFLDEIGELPLQLQVKLLRFLQDQRIERVGGSAPLQVDVRIVAATNRDLEEMIERGDFREDLYYRINTITMTLPPLREREDDLLLLATRFLHRYNREFSRNIRGFSSEAIAAVSRYEWPGNVRELDNRVKRAVIMAAGRVIQPSDLDLPDSADGADPAAGVEGMIVPGGVGLREARDALEARMVRSALVRNSGNVSAAAQELGVSRPSLHDMIKKHGIDTDDYRTRADR